MTDGGTTAYAAPVIKRWHARIAVASLFFLSGLCFSSWASRIPAIQSEMGLNEAALGGVLLGIPVGSMVSMPLAGWMIARMGSKIVLLSAAVLYALLLPLLGLAGTPASIVLLLFFFGVAGDTLNIAMNAQAVGVEGMFNKSIMSSFHGLWSLAGLAGAGIGTLMINFGIAPFRHFLYVTLLALVIIALSAGYVLKHDKPQGSKQPVFVRPDKTLIWLGLIAFCSMICEGAMYDWSGVYFKEVVKAPGPLITAGYAAFTLAATTGRFTGDWFATKYGIPALLRASGFLTTAGLLLVISLPHVWTAALGCLLVGWGVATVVPLVYGRSGKHGVMPPGMAIAAVSSLGYLGFLFGPPAIGMIAGFTDLRVSFLVIAVIGLMMAVLAGKTR